MFESDIAGDVARAVLETAMEMKAIRVQGAQLRIGALRVVDEGLLMGELAQSLKGTVAEGMKFELVRTPAKMRCASCGEVYEVTVGQPETYDCPSCGGKRHELASGMEIDLADVRGLAPAAGEQGLSIADKLAKAVEDALGPVEKPAE